MAEARRTDYYHSQPDLYQGTGRERPHNVLYVTLLFCLSLAVDTGASLGSVRILIPVMGKT